MISSVTVKTAPAVEPVTRAELRAFLRLEEAESAVTTAISIAPGSQGVAAAYSLVGAAVDVLGVEATAVFETGTFGTGGTVAAKVQESSDNTSWADWAGGAFASPTASASQAIDYSGTKRYIRVVATVGVAACNFSATVAKRTEATAENALLDGLIAAARDWCESYTGRRFITQTLVAAMDRFPCRIELPGPPCISVTSIKYLDGSNVQRTLAATEYTLYVAAEPARIYPAFGKSWPSALGQFGAIEVEYVAGFGAAASNVPDGIRTAVKMLAAHWHENREPVAPDESFEAPFTITALLDRWRIFAP